MSVSLRKMHKIVMLNRNTLLQNHRLLNQKFRGLEMEISKMRTTQFFIFDAEYFVAEVVIKVAEYFDAENFVGAGHK
jgi:hypothetical protein